MATNMKEALKDQGDQIQMPIDGLVQEGAGESEMYPLSFSQHRLWFLDQWNPGSTVYNIPVAVRLEGTLNRKALEQTLNEIVRRHEALRTTFSSVNGEPVQVIAPAPSFALEYVDLTEIPASEREREALKIATEEADRGFDLARGPLFRGSLLGLTGTEHILLLTMHHIVSDGWSMGVLVKELVFLYESFSAGRPPLLPELPVQYADFALWQKEYLQGEVLEKQLSYWRQRLGGDLPVLEFPTDHPRPTSQTFRGAQLSKTLPPELAGRIRKLCYRSGTTLFMTMLAAFKVLLNRYTGQEDIIVGTPVANRNRGEIEGLIGFFVNTLAMRTDLSRSPSFGELLGRVREATLGAYDNQDVPFEMLVQDLQPERDPSRSPLFQVLFVVQNAPIPPLEFPGLRVSMVDVEQNTAKFDLTLVVQDGDDGFVVSLEYNTDLFREATARRMLGHLETLLQGITADQEVHIADLPMLTDTEKDQVLTQWNDTSTQYSGGECLHELIESQVAATPDGVAVQYGEERLTYRELNERANQVAHYLRGLGVGPERTVGICMQRSLEMVVSLLGVLKSGGAYIPLDPAYPQRRLESMIEDAEIGVILTHSPAVAAVKGSKAIPVLVDEEWEEISRFGKENSENRTGGNNLAYIIYTSGSTGKPKGAMNTHAGIRNRLLWMQQEYGLGVDDAVLQKTPYSFDVSVWEFFWPLMTGARLVVAEPGGHQDSSYLVREIKAKGITTIHFVPSMLQVFLQEDGIEACRSLRRVICSGEALTWDAQQKFFTRLDCELHNLYGPTEAAVDVTYWRCPRGTDDRTVPIGAPIANITTYILDPDLNIVPIGVKGELYLGGVGVGRGYLKKPELTAEKFVASPYAKNGERLYKTGDVARYLENGAIEYLGRIDDQVKVRGLRIELGEIKAAVSEHPTVEEAVVVVTDDGHEGKRIVAYVVGKRGVEVNASQLQDHVRQTLPEYMVPSSVVVLEAMPLNANGKVDRKALPVPELGRANSKAEFVAPRDIVEETVAAIWTEVLGAEKIGVHDQFFDLGGHSLLATQVLSRLQQTFRVVVPIRDFFEGATVAEVSKALVANETRPGQTQKIAKLRKMLAGMSAEDRERIVQDKKQRAGVAELLGISSPDSKANPILVPMRVEGSKPPLFCIHPAGGQVIVYQHLSASLGPDQPFYCLQSRALAHSELEHSSIEEMAREYAGLIRKQQPEGPYHLMGWSMGGVVAVNIAGELERANQKVAFVGLVDSYSFPDAAAADQTDPFLGLMLAFGGSLPAGFEGLDSESKEAIRDELLALPPEHRIGRAVEWARGRNMIPAGLSAEVLQEQVNLSERHHRLLRGHHPPVIQAPLSVWWAREDLSGNSQPDWGRHTAGELYSKTLDGDHFSLVRPPNSDVLGSQIAERLASVSECD